MQNKSPENQPRPPKLPEESDGNLDQDLDGSVDSDELEREGEKSLKNTLEQINKLEQVTKG